MPKNIIEFELLAETTVVSHTVRMDASITAMINKTGDLVESTLTTRLQAMMKKIIDVKWNFSNMQRAQDNSGMERVTLVATARVSESENHDLDGRRREASSPGLTITAIHTDTTPPLSEIEVAESALRADLIAKAIKEIDVVNKAMQAYAPYHIDTVRFATAQGDVFSLSNAGRGSPKTAMAASYGSGMSDEGLGNAVKLTMRATIRYRRGIAPAAATPAASTP